jgi:hypothetical protein
MIPNSVTYNPREIAQLCGLQPWQTYYDSEGVVLSRDGDTVSLIANAYRDLDLAELSELQRAIKKAAKDMKDVHAKAKAYVDEQREKLNCKLIGQCVAATYSFGDYSVSLEHSTFRRGWTNIRITKAGIAVTAVNFSQNRELTAEAAELHLRNYLETQAEKENHEND